MQISNDLTEKQKDAIKSLAIEMAFEDAQQHSDYLHSIIQQWVSAMDIEDQIRAISSDEDIIPDLLSFDPSTGRLWEEE